MSHAVNGYNKKKNMDTMNGTCFAQGPRRFSSPPACATSSDWWICPRWKTHTHIFHFIWILRHLQRLKDAATFILEYLMPLTAAPSPSLHPSYYTTAVESYGTFCSRSAAFLFAASASAERSSLMRCACSNCDCNRQHQEQQQWYGILAVLAIRVQKISQQY